MFSFLKPKKQENQFAAMLKLEASAYSRAVAKLFDIMDPPTRAHVLVAYYSLLPLFEVMGSEYRKRGEQFTVEQFIVTATERLDAVLADEMRSRRGRGSFS